MGFQQKKKDVSHIEILKQEVTNRLIRNVYLFYGAEDFLIRKYVSQIEAVVVSPDFKELNIQVLEGKLDVQTLIDACLTVPFLSEKKLLIVKNSGLFKKLKSEEEGEEADDDKTAEPKQKKKNKEKDPILDFLGALPSHVVLIFCESEIDKRKKIVDIIAKKGLVVEFSYQKPEDLAKWIGLELKSQHIRILPEDAAFLVELSDPGMTALYSQIQKLITFVSNKGQVERQDIEKMVVRSIKSIIFDLTGAICERNVKKSLGFLKDMIELKEPMPLLFYMIASQFRKILSIKMLLNQGVLRSNLAQKMKLHPYAVEKLLPFVDRFSTQELREAVKESYAIDFASKNGLLDAQIAAELLIIQFAGRKA